jgi:PncC family amidohydrolase
VLPLVVPPVVPVPGVVVELDELELGGVVVVVLGGGVTVVVSSLLPHAAADSAIATAVAIKSRLVIRVPLCSVEGVFLGKTDTPRLTQRACRVRYARSSRGGAATASGRPRTRAYNAAIRTRRGTAMEKLLPIAEKIAALLKQRNETIAVAESSAGGLISAALLALPGASAYFIGGGVTYTRKSLVAMLQASEDELRSVTPGTEASALMRARLARERIGTTWGLSEAGAAGPTGSRYGYPAGHTAIAVAGPADAAKILETGSAERFDNMYAFSAAALELLADTLASARR